MKKSLWALLAIVWLVKDIKSKIVYFGIKLISSKNFSVPRVTDIDVYFMKNKQFTVEFLWKTGCERCHDLIYLM